MGQTQHFTPEFFRFLGQLKRNNDREWFSANKSRYETCVRDPFLKFIADFAPVLAKISPYFVADPSPTGGSMMRIYRDIRFSKDKSPYKTAIAAHFSHESRTEESSPAFYLRLEPGNSMVGGGMWRPENNSLKKVRNAIAKESAKWRKATSANGFRASFGMGGDALLRAPRGYDENHPFVEDIKRKDFVAGAVLQDAEVCNADFTETFAKHLRIMAPYMKFLTEAVGLPF